MDTRSKKILALAVAATGLTSLIAATLPEALSTSFSKSGETSQRSFEFTYHVTIPRIPKDAENIEICIPVPRSNDQQTVANQSVTSNH